MLIRRSPRASPVAAECVAVSFSLIWSVSVNFSPRKSGSTSLRSSQTFVANKSFVPPGERRCLELSTSQGRLAIVTGAVRDSEMCVAVQGLHLEPPIVPNQVLPCERSGLSVNRASRLAVLQSASTVPDHRYIPASPPCEDSIL